MNPSEEVTMEEQLLLPFEEDRSAWIKRIWKSMAPEKRREVVAALAQMACHSIERRTQQRKQADESR
jgi:hypothetical protein